MQLGSRMVSRRWLAVELAAAALVLRYGATLIGKWLSDRQYDGLEGIVSFSSRIIAAWRALEAEQQGALFSDPLAETLAGGRAMQRARKRVQAQGGVLSQELQAATGRTYQVSRVAIRTLWFDERLLAALDPARQPQPLRVDIQVGSGSRGVNDGSGGDGGGARLRLEPNATPRQVVLLGAGMDTRAWRLQLPPGKCTDHVRRVRWFEVDRADVLAAKRAAMTAAAASFAPVEAADGTAGSSVSHPLRASNYASLAVDLRERGWTKSLAAQGFDPSAPTVWLAEGLLMYLEREANHTMLREIAEVSAPGSVLLALSVTEAVIKSFQAKQSAGQLLSQFVWGCPADPCQEFRDLGWDVQALDTRSKMVRDFGLQRDIVSDFGVPTNDYNSLFIVATPYRK